MTAGEPTPLVSAFMSVYNGERYLDEAIGSVLSQSYPNFEFVIVDDGSTDRTPEILARIDDSRVRVIRKAHEGLGVPLNPSLRECRGEFVMRLDADDVCHVNRMVRQVTFLQAHPEVVVVGCQFEPFSDGRTGRPTRLAGDDASIRAGMLEGTHTMSHATIMWRRSLLDVMDGYAYSGPGEDWSFLLNAARHGDLPNLPDVLYRVRFHTSSATWRTSSIIIKGFAYARARYLSFDERSEPLTIDEFEQTWAERPPLERAKLHFRALSADLWRVSVVDELAGRRVRSILALGAAAVLDPHKTLGAIKKWIAHT